MSDIYNGKVTRVGQERMCGGECSGYDQVALPKSGAQSDAEILESLRVLVAAMPPSHRENVETIRTALVELVRRYGSAAKIALILFASEIVVEPDETSNAPDHRREAYHE